MKMPHQGRRFRRIVSMSFLLAAACLLWVSGASGEDGAEDGGAGTPVFQVPSGIYAEPFDLTISGGDGGAVVRYTLDGSVPTGDSAEYTGPIRIADRTGEAGGLAGMDPGLFTREEKEAPETVRKGTVIRAACFDQNGRSGETVTATYLVGLPETGAKTISIVADSADLFDYEKGIYVLGKTYDDWRKETPDADSYLPMAAPGNFTQRGRDWERPAHVDIIGADGSLLHAQELGLRIMGGSTRSYYQKSFRLLARKEYGAKNVKCELIDGLKRERDGEPLEKMKSFVLRNGGQDNQGTLLRDPLIQKLVNGCRFSTQSTEPCQVYLNGEYWGAYTITEDYSDDYIEDNYDIAKDNVVMIKAGELEEGLPEDLELYQSMMERISGADFTDPEDYRWIGETMDLDSFMDYAIVQIYIDNQDSLFGIYGEANWRIWRSRVSEEGNEYGDGRWRFMLYDTENSFAMDKTDRLDLPTDRNTLGLILQKPGEGFTELLQKLMENEDFHAAFVSRFLQIREECFQPDQAVETLWEMADRYRPLMNDQVLRNGPAEAVEEYGSGEEYFDRGISLIEAYLYGRYAQAAGMVVPGESGEEEETEGPI